MRNYVIINGVNSLTKNGLAIKDLPPITKTMMRTLREEIDGRDGDIITELGYSAYDKSMTIGLFGTGYDIDDIIAFFNQSGTIVFSNEPDKFYNFKIIDQIEYNKLLKFKEATIRFHCQPFKYPLNEVPLEEEYQYVNGTGTDITLDNTSEAIFNKIELQGNTSQDGTPTPSTPIPVNVVGGDNEINVVGKNLFDYRLFSNNTISGITLTNNNDGSITINGTATATSVFEATSLVAIGENYKISGCYGGSSSTYKLDFFNPSTSTFYACFNGEETALANNITGKVRIVVYSGTTVNNVKIYPMLSTIGGEFQLYQGNTYNIDLPEGMELCKIGNYQDYFYKDSDKWYLHKEIGKAVFNGSESWTYALQSNVSRFDTTITNAMSGSATNNPILSTHFKSEYALTNGSIFLSGSGNTITIMDNDFSNTNDFKNWLSSTDVIVYYAYVTPTNTLIEDTTLIDQLEAIKNAISRNGQTNISQTNNDMPFVLDLSALELNSDHLVIDNIGNIFSKPTLDLEGTGIVDIYLNDIQMVKVDLTENNEIIINTDEMEAFNPETGALANRQVTGEYDVFKLDPGENDLRFSGNLTKATITNYERWL